jgi:hypothetical protein
MKMNHIMSVENHISEPAEPVPVGEPNAVRQTAAGSP